MLARFWTYQHERFPLLSHGALIAVFSASAMAYSAWARGAAFPPAWLLLAGFVSSLLFFLQLRIADEWKDAAEDAAFRPYRPVPRGLVSLRELAWIGVAGGIVQLVIALAISPHVLPLLVAVWAFFGLMSREFFIGAWLRKHSIVYMTSHMLIMPLIDAYVSSFDWQVAGVHPPVQLWLFLGVTFCNGMVLEIGRKIRAPRDEEPGVETYSAIWGRARAAYSWLAAIAVTVALAILAGFAVHATLPIFIAAASAASAAGALAWLFLRNPITRMARSIEALSGAWTLALYGSLGIAPFILRSLS